MAYTRRRVPPGYILKRGVWYAKTEDLEWKDPRGGDSESIQVLQGKEGMQGSVHRAPFPQ